MFGTSPFLVPDYELLHETEPTQRTILTAILKRSKDGMASRDASRSLSQKFSPLEEEQGWPTTITQFNQVSVSQDRLSLI